MPRKRSKSPKHRSKRAKSKAKSRSKSKNRKYGGAPLPDPTKKELKVPKYGFEVDISHWTRSIPNTNMQEYFHPTVVQNSTIFGGTTTMNPYPTYMESNIDKRFIYVEWREGQLDKWTYRTTDKVPVPMTGSGAQDITEPEVKTVGFFSSDDPGVIIKKNDVIKTNELIVGCFEDKPCIKIYIERNTPKPTDSILTCKVYFSNNIYTVYIFSILTKDGIVSPYLWNPHNYTYSSKEEMLKVIGDFITKQYTIKKKP
jgi:hypothetical protein